MRRPIRNINIHPGQPPGYLNFERQACLNSRYVIGHRSGQMPYHNTGRSNALQILQKYFPDCKFDIIYFACIIMYGLIFYECHTGRLEVRQVCIFQWFILCFIKKQWPVVSERGYFFDVALINHYIEKSSWLRKVPTNDFCLFDVSCFSLYILSISFSI